MAASLAAGSLIYAFMQGYLSGHANKAMFAIVPLMALAAVSLHRALAAEAVKSSAPPWWGELSVLALCAGVAWVTLEYRLAYNYEGAPPSALTRQFTHPLLRGLYEQPERVNEIEALARSLSALVEPGQLLLAYDHAPLVYYLSRTRPALDHAWTHKRLPRELRSRSVQRMIDADRVPRFAVQRLDQTYSRRSRKDPVHAFVAARYEPIEEVGGYRIWRLRDDSD